ncbi:ISAzo13-like element transposase-related protein [Arthrobacter roseus]|uniref:ISAzo13-like element transposase-related protein n=1 Tax=Arthrobacter roseus TaxID=136274 RepID=UPI0030841698
MWRPREPCHRRSRRVDLWASDRTVARMPWDMCFSPQACAKVTEGFQHEDRRAQFAGLSEKVAEHMTTGQPVVSVKAKQKELVRAWRIERTKLIAGLVRITRTIGPEVQSALDTEVCPAGLMYTAKDGEALRMTCNDFHSEWKYAMLP